MSKPINPVTIGSFTLGALLLLVLGIFVFGGGQLLNADKVRFVVFFDSSLNGLEIGAPVKMQGVKIGEVTEIALELDPKSSKVYKPVVLSIDRNTFSGADGAVFPKAMSKSERLHNRDKLVAAGFRARLETQSLLTGLLYVDFDVHPDKPPEFTKLQYKGLLEIPGIPTTADELKNTAEEVFKKLRTLPLDQIVEDFSASLKEIKDLLASDDVKKSRIALAKTLEQMEQTTATLNRNLGPMLIETNKTIRNTNLLVLDVHRDIKPVLASADKTLAAASAALNKAQDSLAKVDGALGPESTLNETLESLKETSRSIRDLTDYLERHPESLLSGKEN